MSEPTSPKSAEPMASLAAQFFVGLGDHLVSGLARFGGTQTVEKTRRLDQPAEARQNVAVRAVKSIIDRFCGGSAEELVVGMVNSAVIDRNLLDRLARKVAEGKIGEKSESKPRNRSEKKGS